MVPLDTPLEIAACRLFEVAVPLREPYRMSSGSLRTRRSLVVEVTDRSGAVGYGESAPFERPFYSEETLYSAKACIIQHLIPRMAGKTFPGLEPAVRALERGVRGNRMARAGVETALWDLLCAKTGHSLRSLIGAAMRRVGVPDEQAVSGARVEVGAALGIPEDGQPDTLADQACLAIHEGYRRVKIKVLPGWDVAAVQAVRHAAHEMGSKIRIWADANGAYSHTEDFEALQALDREHLVMLEQPLPPDDTLGTIRLAHELITPICLDESLTDDRAGQLFLEYDGPRVWNIKVQRVGGLWESVRLYKRALDADVRLWAGSMPETGLGMHAVLSLAAFKGFVYPSDAEPSARWYTPGTDLLEWRMDAEGMIAVSDAAGLCTMGVKEKLEQLGRVVA
jgi:O-succinylbenzoate synthase